MCCLFYWTLLLPATECIFKNCFIFFCSFSAGGIISRNISSQFTNLDLIKWIRFGKRPFRSGSTTPCQEHDFPPQSIYCSNTFIINIIFFYCIPPRKSSCQYLRLPRNKYYQIFPISYLKLLATIVSYPPMSLLPRWKHSAISTQENHFFSKLSCHLIPVEEHG